MVLWCLDVLVWYFMLGLGLFVVCLNLVVLFPDVVSLLYLCLGDGFASCWWI